MLEEARMTPREQAYIYIIFLFIANEKVREKYFYFHRETLQNN